MKQADSIGSNKIVTSRNTNSGNLKLSMVSHFVQEVRLDNTLSTERMLSSEAVWTSERTEPTDLVMAGDRKDGRSCDPQALVLYYNDIFKYFFILMLKHEENLELNMNKNK
jgi:hypothetical protein